MDFFEQKFLFNRVRIDYQENGILYSYGNIINSKQYFIEYEHVLLQTVTKETKTDKFNLFVCFVSAVVVLKSMLGVYDNPTGIYKGLLPVSLLFLLVFSVVTYLGRTKLVFIETVDGASIKLYGNKQNQAALSEFLKDFNQHVKAYLKKKYTEIDADVPKEAQLENLFWLKKNKIISKAEYEGLKSTLLAEKPKHT